MTEETENTEEQIRVAFSVHTDGFPVPRKLQALMTEQELEALWEHLDSPGRSHRGADPGEVPLGFGMNRGYVIEISPEERKTVEDEGFAHWVNALPGNAG